MLLLAIVFGWPILTHVFLSIKYWWWNYQRPGTYTTLISEKEYKTQSQSSTKQALEELRAYLNEHPHEWERVKEENETRVRRFAHGQDHLHIDLLNADALTRRRSWLASCTLQ